MRSPGEDAQPTSDEELHEALHSLDEDAGLTHARLLRRTGFAGGLVFGLLLAGALGVAWFGLHGVRSNRTGSVSEARIDREASLVESTPTVATWKTFVKMVVEDEGEEITSFFSWSRDDCFWKCGNNSRCNSVTICDVKDGHQCHLKSAVINTLSPRKYNEYCTSGFRTVDSYVPDYVPLALPSNAPELTFYMYRAKSGASNYPLENVNTASIGAVMWYIHNEAIYSCDGTDGSGHVKKKGNWGDRKYGIDTIMRFKVTIKTSTPIYQRGMNFSAFTAFDFGEATGPHRDSEESGSGTGWLHWGEWNQFGFTPGCAFVGYSPLDQKDFLSAKHYPNAIWYSLPGRCPTMTYATATSECHADLPGGLCETVTGQGNCTYSVEDAGWIDLDELVGITPKWVNRGLFCLECGIEGTIDSGGGCKLDFWGPNIKDTLRNQQRVDAAIAMFEEKYPSSPKERDLMKPICDFNKWAYLSR